MPAGHSGRRGAPGRASAHCLSRAATSCSKPTRSSWPSARIPTSRPSDRLVQTEQAVLQVDRATLATSLDGVFAGGDAATMSRYVSVAVGEGRRAAWGIAAYLEHPDAQPLPQLDLVAGSGGGVTSTPTTSRRRSAPRRSATARRAAPGRLSRGRPGLHRRAGGVGGRALHELRPCIECDNCFVFCPGHGDQERRPAR